MKRKLQLEEHAQLMTTGAPTKKSLSQYLQSKAMLFSLPPTQKNDQAGVFCKPALRGSSQRTSFQFSMVADGDHLHEKDVRGNPQKHTEKALIKLSTNNKPLEQGPEGQTQVSKGDGEVQKKLKPREPQSKA